MSDLDLGAYLTRIGAAPGAGLAEIHRAHLGAIPFENLDPHRGIPVGLELAALQDKLVTRRRGGYCFEQNLLLKAALEALGYRVALHLARVHWNLPAGATPSRSHLVLGVEDAGSTWLADVGFGPGSLLEPIRFAPGSPVEQSGWQLHLVEAGGQLILQTVMDEVWRDVYAIDPVPVPMVDVEVSNWYVCTHPHSRFVAGLTVGIVIPEGTFVTLRGGEELELVVRSASASERRIVDPHEVPALLESEFGLPGFSVGPDGRIQSR